VVGQLLDALGRHRREHRIGGAGEPVQDGEAPGGQQQQAHDAAGEVEVVGQLGQSDVAELGLRAPVGERVLVPVAPLDVPGPAEQHPGLAEEVERGVGQRHLLLQLGGVRHPLREPVAVEQRVVAEHQAVGGQVGRVDAVGHRRGDLRTRLLHAGPERPARVVVGDGVGEGPVGVGGVVVVLGSVATHRCGTSSGIA
jgi:hypothetical protein